MNIMQVSNVCVYVNLVIPIFQILLFQKSILEIYYIMLICQILFGHVTGIDTAQGPKVSAYLRKNPGKGSDCFRLRMLHFSPFFTKFSPAEGRLDAPPTHSLPCCHHLRANWRNCVCSKYYTLTSTCSKILLVLVVPNQNSRLRIVLLVFPRC